MIWRSLWKCVFLALILGFLPVKSYAQIPEMDLRDPTYEFVSTAYFRYYDYDPSLVYRSDFAVRPPRNFDNNNFTSAETACRAGLTHALDNLRTTYIPHSASFASLSPANSPGPITIENNDPAADDQVFSGYRCMITTRYDPESSPTTHWFYKMSARAICESGQPFDVDGVLKCSPLPNGARDSTFSDCDGTTGDKPVAAAPGKCVGNPIAIDSGAKQQSEQDYGTADGLLGITRHYRSRTRDGSAVTRPKARFEGPGFGTYWRGLLPGQILVYRDGNDWRAQYYPDTGGVRDFVLAPDISGNWSFSKGLSQTRLTLKIGLATDSNVDPDAIFGASASAPPQLQLSFANGDNLRFSASGGFDPALEQRLYVPVEHSLANGYTRTFVYASNDEYATAVSDNLGRQLIVNWVAMGWLHDSIYGLTKGQGQASPQLGFTLKKAIGSIGLPDGTLMQYSYGVSSASGFAGRLQTAYRLTAANEILWGRTYLYGDSRFPDALTGILDQNGARLSTYAYNSNGQATLTERAGGFDRNIITYTNEGVGRDVQDARTVTSPLGANKKYRYTGFYADLFEGQESVIAAPRKLLATETGATPTTSALTTTHRYDGQGMVSGSVDGNGNDGSQSNDQNQRPALITDASGVETAVVWHATWDLPTRITRKNLQTDFTYSAQGQLATITQRDLQSGIERITQITPGIAGRILAINGPRLPDSQGRDDIATMTYDAQGNQLTLTNALGHVTRYEGHDASGRPARVIDANGIVTELAYDLLGRVMSTRVKHPADATRDAVTLMEYDVEGRVIAITRPDTANLRFDYNLAGLMTAMRSDDGERIDYSHDAAGNVLSQTVKRADGTQAFGIQRSFDALGRIISQTLGAGSAKARTIEFAYDNVGNMTQLTSALGNVVAQSFDSLNRLVESVAPDGGMSQNYFDGATLNDGTPIVAPGAGPSSELGAFQDGIGVVTQFTRNAFGDVLTEISPDRGTTMYDYDLASDVTAMVDGRGQRIEYTRDILGRVIAKTPISRPVTERVSYTYDTPAITGSASIGRLSRIDDGSGATRFAYDHRGNLVTRFQKLVGTPDWVALRYAYDLADRIEIITYPSGRQVRYVRNIKGQVVGVRTRANNTVANWTVLSSNMSYEAFGALKTINYGNGERMIVARGDDGRMDGRRLYKLADGANVSHLTYGYDADDNMTRITDRLDAAKTQSFAYDAVGRLSRVTLAAGDMQRTDYVYDANGNKVRELRRPLPTDPPSVAVVDRYTLAPGSNRLAKIVTPNGNRTLGYDPRGNLIQETRPGGISITAGYDGQGRLISYARSGEASLTHVYNGMDDRVATTTTLSGGGSDTRRFVYAPDGRVLGEYGSSASDVRAEFIWLSPQVGDAGMFGGDDGLGGYMPLAVATPDPLAGAGATQLSWVHANHMGVPIRYSNASGTTLAAPTSYSIPGFPGQSRTPGLGSADLYYNRYRDYDSSTGRYIQADPIGLAGGPSPYSYAMNNPLRYTDPTGQCPWCVVIVVGMAVGAVTEIGTQAFNNWWNGRDVFDRNCYDWGEVGIAAGFGAAGGGAGRVIGGGLRYGARSLTRETGLEWSHSVGRAWVNRNTSGGLNQALNTRGGLNGRWVTPQQHYRHDPYRYPAGWRQMPDRYEQVWRQNLDRTPEWLRGAGVGTAAGMGVGEADGQ
jgi:RHS repeat-associated protein